MKKRAITRRGFTLVELLVVISIIGVLVALLIPAVHAARASARRTQCQNNLRQVGLAISNYDSAMGVFPPGQTWSGDRRKPGTVDYAWSAMILPYLEEGTTYDQIQFDKSYLAGPNLSAASQVISVYLCPAAGLYDVHRINDQVVVIGSGSGGNVKLGCIDYLGISGPDKDAKNPATQRAYGPQGGVLIGTKWFPGGDRLREPPAIKASSISDGLTKTLCVTECTGRGLEDDGDPNGAWVSGKNVTHIDKGVNSKSAKKSWDDERIFSQHPGGALGLYCGGNVSLLPESMDPIAIRALCSRNGGETIPAP